MPAPLNDGMGLFRAALTKKVIVVPGEFFDVNPGKRRQGRASRFRAFSLPVELRRQYVVVSESILELDGQENVRT